MTKKTLVNFNMPVHMKEELSDLLKYKGYTRTSLILQLLDGWIREERKEIQSKNDMKTKALMEKG